MVAGASYRSDAVLVGRDPELRRLRAALGVSGDRASYTVIIEGEPGVGKTALVSSAIADASTRDDSALVLQGVCLPLASITMPFIGIRSALRGLALLPGDEATLLPSPDLDDSPTRVPVLIDEWIDRITGWRRLVLTIDDLQWADGPTLDALMYLAAGPNGRPLTLIGTIRSLDGPHPRPVDRWMAQLGRVPRVVVLRLENLTREATAEQVSVLLGWPPDQSLVQDIYEKTRGHPYLTELTVAGLARGVTHLPADLPSTLTSAVLGAVRTLSPDAQAAMALLAICGRPMDSSALERVLANGGSSVPRGVALGSLLNEALDTGVVVEQPSGFWFRHPLTAELIESGLPGADRRRLHVALSNFEEAVGATGGAELDHALRIAEHHHRSGDVEQAYAAALKTAEVARESGAYLPELRLLLRALEVSPSLAADPIARYDLLCRARRAAEDAGAGDDELSIVEDTLASDDLPELVRAELMLRRIRLRGITLRERYPVAECEAVLAITRAHPSSWQHARALSLWVDAELEGGSAPKSSITRASVSAVAIARSAGQAQTLACALVAEARVRLVLGERAAAAEAFTTAIPVSLASREWVAFNDAAGGITEATGVLLSARTARMLHAYRQDLVAAGAPHVYVAWLAGFEAIAWLFVGEWRECVNVLRFVAGHDPGPYSDAALRLTAARLAVLQGDQATAEAHVARVEVLAETHHRFTSLGLDSIHAEVRLAAHDPEGALLAALAGIQREERPDFAEWLPPLAARALADLAERERDRGQNPAVTLDRLDRFLRSHADIAGQAPQGGNLAREQVTALSLLLASEVARARRAEGEHYAWAETADALADADFPWEEAYACQRLAEATLRGSGGARRLGTARVAIRRGLALTDRLWAAPVGASLRRLAVLAHIDVGERMPGGEAPALAERRASHPRLQRLTDREREVLRHIVAGDTYAETASALFISEKTVSAHVSHLLAKTGTSNRFELAQLAAEPPT
jgi:DNA-binding CsgD family transcriptional regulator